MSSPIRSKITGMGLNVPKKVLTNHDLEKMVETSDEWITTRTGIKERRIADDGVSSSDLALPAALEALEDAGVRPSELDLIICATSTPDRMFPTTACILQRELKAAQCGAFDLLAACSGFVYGLTTADSFIRAGSAKNILVVGSEVLNHLIDWTNRDTCVLFGDGAGAAVLSAVEGESGIIDSRIHANGEYSDFLMVGTGSANPIKQDTFENKDHYVKMKGNQTFKVAVNTMSDVTREILEKHGITPDDIDLIVPHQANIRILNAVGKNLGVSEDKVFINVRKYGNTSAATIPIALYEARAEGRIKDGDLVLLVAFGGGFTWGATLIRW